MAWQEYQAYDSPLTKAMNCTFILRGGLMGMRVDEGEGDGGEEGRVEGGRGKSIRTNDKRTLRDQESRTIIVIVVG